MDLRITPIQAEDTWPIRQFVLWPDQPISHCMLEDDAIGSHFGGYIDDRLVCVASLFPDGEGVARLRKFATLPDYQNLGLGTQMLQHIIAELPRLNTTTLWCHARTAAMPFYQRFGFEPAGEAFNKGPVSYWRAELTIPAA